MYFIDIGTLKHGIHAYEKILIMTIWQWYKILKYMYMCIIDIKYILKKRYKFIITQTTCTHN